jgi:hypothetical protein
VFCQTASSRGLKKVGSAQTAQTAQPAQTSVSNSFTQKSAQTALRVLLRAEGGDRAWTKGGVNGLTLYPGEGSGLLRWFAGARWYGVRTGLYMDTLDIEQTVSESESEGGFRTGEAGELRALLPNNPFVRRRFGVLGEGVRGEQSPRKCTFARLGGGGGGIDDGDEPMLDDSYDD